MLHREVGKQEWKETFEVYFQTLAVLCDISYTHALNPGKNFYHKAK
jgi:hypothetical protein